MKKHLLTLIAACFLTYTPHQKSFASSSEDKSQNILIYTLIAKRCDHYLKANEISKCQSTVSLLVEELDAHIIFTGTMSFVFAVFKSDLIKILSSSETTTFLKDFNQAMSDYLVGTLDNLNLWQMSLDHFQTKDNASKVLAALFQDTSLARLHLAYLKKAGITGNATFHKNKNLLNQTIENMNLVFDYSKSNFQKLFYPPASKGPLNRNIYHFYVPLSLSFKLQAQGVDNQMAFTAPLLMTLTYEFITSESDHRYLLEDPKFLDPVKHDWKIKDIFAGYQGAAMGTMKTPIKTLKFLKDSFSTSTNEAVMSML